MADFNGSLISFLKQLCKAFPTYQPLKKLKTKAKNAIRQNPDGPQEAWTAFFTSDPDALVALQNGDLDALVDSPCIQASLGEVAKLWHGMSGTSKLATLKHIENLRDTTGLASGANQRTVAAAKTWSDVFTKILGKRVVVPSLFLQKVEDMVGIAKLAIANMNEDGVSEESLEELLDGVDMDLGSLNELAASIVAEAGEQPLNAVAKLLPQLKQWAESSGESNMDSDSLGKYVLEKLDAPTYAEILAGMRSTLVNVKATFIQSALRRLAEALNTSSLDALVRSAQELEMDAFEEEVRGIMSGVDSSRAQAMVESFMKLLQQSGLAETLKLGETLKGLGVGGAGGGAASGSGMVSRIVGSDMAPGMISQLPSAVREDGSIDVGRMAALALKARKAKRPRITGRS